MDFCDLVSSRNMKPIQILMTLITLDISQLLKAGEKPVVKHQDSFEGLASSEAGRSTDLFVSPRTDQKLLFATGSVDRTLSKKWTSTFRARVGDFAYDPIEEPGAPSVTTVDRQEFQVGAGFARQLGREGTLGFEFSTGVNDFENGNEDTIHTAALTITNTIGKHTRINASLGAFRTEAEPAMAMNFEDDGVLVGFGLTRESRAVLWTLDLARQPSAATSQSTDTVTTNTASLRLAPRAPVRWFWNASYAWAQREGDGTPDVDRKTLAAWLERRFKDRHGLRLSASQVDQSGNGVTIEDADFYNAYLSWVWYPRGVAS